ncbi:MAG TPA: hypothetical protein VG963_20620 [Polyangiaceae bacterium]|nr:hypothetical protein [Polyangiaceae bacterium]
MRVDFESDLEGWQTLPNARPSDALDRIEQSTALAHHGSGALRMVFDGQSTTPPPILFDPGPFFGVYAASSPPPGAEVSLWMFSTAAGVSVAVYAQTSPTLAPTVLVTVPLPESAWREIGVSMPLAAAQQFGIRVDAPADVRGDVYLDEIRW